MGEPQPERELHGNQNGEVTLLRHGATVQAEAQPARAPGMLMRSPLARERRRPAGFIVPCAPTLRETAPSGPQWIHEIKHDGFRIIARKEGERVRLWSRNGLDWSADLAAITAGLRALPTDQLVMDGEAVAHCAAGLPDFHGLLGDGAANASLFAFDLLMVDSEDVRRQPTEARKARLARLLRKAPGAVRYVEHLEGDGPEIYRHACALGLEGIVSKRRDVGYRSRLSPAWVKVRNPNYERR